MWSGKQHIFKNNTQRVTHSSILSKYMSTFKSWTGSAVSTLDRVRSFRFNGLAANEVMLTKLAANSRNFVVPLMWTWKEFNGLNQFLRSGSYQDTWRRTPCDLPLSLCRFTSPSARLTEFQIAEESWACLPERKSRVPQITHRLLHPTVLHSHLSFLGTLLLAGVSGKQLVTYCKVLETLLTCCSHSPHMLYGNYELFLSFSFFFL